MTSQIVSLRILAGLSVLLLAGCAKAKVTPIATGSARYPAAAASTVIETYFEGQTPRRQYEQVGIVRGHYSAATAWSTADVTNLLPELQRPGSLAQTRSLSHTSIAIEAHTASHGPYDS